MRYVYVSDPVVLKDIISGEPLKGLTPRTLYHFITEQLLPDKVFTKDRKALNTANRLDALFKDAAVGTYVAVESADWDMLKGVAEAPESGYTPFTRQMVAFANAICDASETPKE